MKEPKDEDLFNLFRSKLTDTDQMTTDIGANWLGMDDLLDGKARKKNTVVWLYRAGAAIAAMLLLFLGWLFTDLKQPVTGKIGKVALNELAKPAPLNKEPTFEKEALKLSKVNPKHVVPVIVNNDTKKGTANSLNSAELARYHENIYRDNKDSLIAQTAGLSNINLQNRTIDYPSDRLILASVTVDSSASKHMINNNNNKTKKTTPTIGPRLALAVMAAPDVNGINSFNGSRAGTNFALQLSLKLTSRLSISTGAAYVDMPYQTNFASYRGTDIGWWRRMFSTNVKPNDVVANCEVLDIPLNINYQLFNKGRNSFAIGTGLSSYFMLTENYRFNFADATVAPTNIDLNNQNRHLLSVLNLNATYQRRVSSNFGIILQPYLKLPLTQIGFGEVNLKSAGIAVGFSWNIRPF